MNTRTQITLGAVPLNVAPASAGLTGNAGMQAEFAEAVAAAEHASDLEACRWCQTLGHDMKWRGYPVLDPRLGVIPPHDLLGDVTGGCWCCFWGPGPTKRGESLYSRLSRQAWQGRDIRVEHRLRSGVWVSFHTRFEVA